jgi:hypothetical protein
VRCTRVRVVERATDTVANGNGHTGQLYETLVLLCNEFKQMTCLCKSFLFFLFFSFVKYKTIIPTQILTKATYNGHTGQLYETLVLLCNEFKQMTCLCKSFLFFFFLFFSFVEYKTIIPTQILTKATYNGHTGQLYETLVLLCNEFKQMTCLCKSFFFFSFLLWNTKRSFRHRYLLKQLTL